MSHVGLIGGVHELGLNHVTVTVTEVSVNSCAPQPAPGRLSLLHAWQYPC
jgi:hypothetical protein